MFHISFLIIECYNLVLCASIVVVVLVFVCEKFPSFFSLATQLLYNLPRIWLPLLTSKQSLARDAVMKFHITKVLCSSLVHYCNFTNYSYIAMLNHLEEIEVPNEPSYMFSLDFLLFSMYSQNVQIQVLFSHWVLAVSWVFWVCAAQLLPFGEVLPPSPTYNILSASLCVQRNVENNWL